MKDTTMFRNLWATIMVLLLMNIGMMCWIWFMPKAQRPPENYFLERELGFSEQQKEAYREMRKKHFDGNLLIHEQIKTKKEAFLKQLTKSNLSDEELLKQSLEIETLAAQINVQNYKHLQQVRKLCTPEQQKQFDEIMDKIATRMAAPQMPPPNNGESPPPQER